MAKQQRSRSQLTSAPLPRRMQFAGSSAGALDPSTQPLPRPEQWGGWASAPQPPAKAEHARRQRRAA